MAHGLHSRLPRDAPAKSARQPAASGDVPAKVVSERMG